MRFRQTMFVGLVRVFAHFSLYMRVYQKNIQPFKFKLTVIYCIVVI